MISTVLLSPPEKAFDGTHHPPTPSAGLPARIGGVGVMPDEVLVSYKEPSSEPDTKTGPQNRELHRPEPGK